MLRLSRRWCLWLSRTWLRSSGPRRRGSTRRPRHRGGIATSHLRRLSVPQRVRADVPGEEPRSRSRVEPGIRTSVGPPSARIHLGGGRTGLSTGLGTGQLLLERYAVVRAPVGKRVPARSIASLPRQHVSRLFKTRLSRPERFRMHLSQWRRSTPRASRQRPDRSRHSHSRVWECCRLWRFAA